MRRLRLFVHTFPGELCISSIVFVVSVYHGNVAIHSGRWAPGNCTVKSPRSRKPRERPRSYGSFLNFLRLFIHSQFLGADSNEFRDFSLRLRRRPARAPMRTAREIFSPDRCSPLSPSPSSMAWTSMRRASLSRAATTASKCSLLFFSCSHISSMRKNHRHNRRMRKKTIAAKKTMAPNIQVLFFIMLAIMSISSSPFPRITAISK